MTTLSLNEKQLPAIKEWKIGKTYRIELEVTMKEIGKGPDYGDGPYDLEPGKKRKEIVTARFEVDSASSDDDGDEDYEKQYAKARQGKM
jgi:hypothetical protein